MNKKELEIILSQLKDFENPKVKLEQYITDSKTAADLLWKAFMSKNVKGKTIADLGCGTGIMGLGALILGARKVYFVDVDLGALKVAKENLKAVLKIMGKKKLNCEFLETNVKNFNKKVHIIIQNPPFGVKQTHQDKLFLVKAMDLAQVVYSFHKLSTKDFVNKFVRDNGFKVKHVYKYKFPIRKRFWFHISRVREIDVGCWYIHNGE